MATALDTHPHRDALHNTLEQWARDAQHYVVVGIHKASEHEYDPMSIHKNIQPGHVRFVALGACLDSDTGHEIVWKVIQLLAAEEEERLTNSV